ncbi:MAG: AAA family ATPase [Bryobacteraceae bacterium]|nr:AAA family ATPase [Bryobacteraceae bacterium]
MTDRSDAPTPRFEKIALSVERFQSIRELKDFELKPITVLIGANGAGKSNFLRVLRLLQAIGDRRLQKFVASMGRANSLLYGGLRSSRSMSVALKIFDRDSNLLGYRTGFESDVQQLFAFSDETTEYMPVELAALGSDQDTILGSGHAETKMDTVEGGVGGAVHRALYGWILRVLGSIGFYHFVDTSEFSSPMRGPSYVENYRTLTSDGANLGAFLAGLRVKHPDYFRRVESTVQLIAPQFDRFELQESRERPDVFLTWKNKSGDFFGPHQLSDGSLRAIALCALLGQPPDSLPGIICLDEPELGLHPYALDVIAGLVKSASTFSRVVVATQSAALVSKFEPEDVVTVEARDGQSVFTRQNSESLKPWLEDYTLGELWEMNLIGGTSLR